MICVKILVPCFLDIHRSLQLNQYWDFLFWADIYKDWRADVCVLIAVYNVLNGFRLILSVYFETEQLDNLKTETSRVNLFSRLSLQGFLWFNFWHRITQFHQHISLYYEVCYRSYCPLVLMIVFLYICLSFSTLKMPIVFCFNNAVMCRPQNINCSSVYIHLTNQTNQSAFNTNGTVNQN